MYQIEQYTSVNNLGTALLLEKVLKSGVQKLIVASSMSVYGEGLYQAPDGRLAVNANRTVEQLRGHQWELESDDGEPLVPVATPEWKTPALASIYALSKFDQEQMCLITGRAYGIPTVALRFFNVYGPFQALSNPYTGVLAIFASRLSTTSGRLSSRMGINYGTLCASMMWRAHAGWRWSVLLTALPSTSEAERALPFAAWRNAWRWPSIKMSSRKSAEPSVSETSATASRIFQVRAHCLAIPPLTVWTAA